MSAVDHDNRYVLRLLWNRWLILSLLYWVAAGIFVWLGGLTPDPLLWVWVITSLSLWGSVGAAYVYVRLAAQRDNRRKSIM
jgi:hypothetical protein